MSNFDTWFRMRVGEYPNSCKWFTTFLLSNNANEVEQIFQEHYDILSTDEMIEVLNNTIDRFSENMDKPGSIEQILQIRDRLFLIEGVSKSGFTVEDAISRHKRQAAFEQETVSSKWYSTFMSSDDPDEVARLFRDHQTTLLTPESVEALKRMIAGYKDYGMDLPAIQATVETEALLALIEDAQRFNIGEAIRRYKLTAACRQKVDHFRDARTFRELTPEEYREAGDALQEWGRTLMSNSPDDPDDPKLINIYKDRLDKAIFQFGLAADWYRHVEGGDEIAETFFRRFLVEEKRIELGQLKSDFKSLIPAYKMVVIDKATSKKPYYQAKLNEFLKRRGLTP